jgi:hypothetical protein
MGVSISKFSEKNEILDFISAHYILTMNYYSLRKLVDKDYCNKLTELITKIIMNYFNESQVLKFAKRIQPGYNNNNNNKENAIYVSKFYVKIAHLFSILLTTIFPNKNINTNISDLMKGWFKNMDVEDLDCPISEKLVINFKKEYKEINNKEKEYKEKDTQNKIIQYYIPEFMDFYMDSEYDVSNGTFNNMSENTKKMFNEELLTFYKTFTENEEMPNTVQKFSDIKLSDYSKKCSDLTSDEMMNNLFSQYAHTLKKIMFNIYTTKQKLLDFLNNLFIFEEERVNPNLTNDLLQQIIDVSRTIIIELYVNTEKDFAETVQIHEAIIETKLLKTLQNQIDTLDKEMDKLYYP